MRLEHIIAASCAVLISSLTCGAAAAADAPGSYTVRSTADSQSLLPTDEDMRKAREEREAGRTPKPQSKSTTVDQVRDQNNRIVEYVVTPGSTRIPYTIQNQSERPADTGPGGNSKSTTGTTRQIRIGW